MAIKKNTKRWLGGIFAVLFCKPRPFGFHPQDLAAALQRGLGNP